MNQTPSQIRRSITKEIQRRRDYNPYKDQEWAKYTDDQLRILRDRPDDDLVWYTMKVGDSVDPRLLSERYTIQENIARIRIPLPALSSVAWRVMDTPPPPFTETMIIVELERRQLVDGGYVWICSDRSS